jgi:hypothetical protein
LFGFGAVRFQFFYIKNQKLYCFLGFFFLLSNGLDFSLVRFFSIWLFYFFQFDFFVLGLWNRNRTELNIFLNILIGFFHDSIFFPRFNQFFTHPCSLVTLKNESQMNKKNFTSINFIFFGMVKEQNYLHWTFFKKKNSLTPRLILFMVKI